MTEIEILEAMENMCAESLTPENFDKWEAVKAGLKLARPLLGEQPSDKQDNGAWFMSTNTRLMDTIETYRTEIGSDKIDWSKGWP